VGELFPLLGGVLAGVAAMRCATWKRGAACVVAISVVLGVVATLVNGEGLQFVPVDMAIVGLTGFAILLVGPRLWAAAARQPPVAGGDERRVEG